MGPSLRRKDLTEENDKLQKGTAGETSLQVPSESNIAMKNLPFVNNLQFFFRLKWWFSIAVLSDRELDGSHREASQNPFPSGWSTNMWVMCGVDEAGPICGFSQKLRDRGRDMENDALLWSTPNCISIESIQNLFQRLANRIYCNVRRFWVDWDHS